MALKTVKKSTLAQQVARQLEGMIVAGEWSAGTLIPPEPELMRQLGVSRNTLREAIRGLTLIGVLEPRPGDGTYVRSTSLLGASLAQRLTGCTLLETLEARECMERSAARLAAVRRTPADVAALQAGLAAIERGLADGESTHRLTERVIEQEARMLQIAGNPILIELFDSIAEPVRTAIRTTLGTLRSYAEVTDAGLRLQHELVGAIADGDEAAAAAAVSTKARLVREWLASLGKTDGAVTGGGTGES